MYFNTFYNVQGSVYEGLDGNQNVGLQTGVRSNGGNLSSSGMF
jgi:hypothetical protein